MRSARILVTLIALALSLVAPASLASAGTPRVTIDWGWVVSRDSSADHTPAVMDQGNSQTGTNTVDRTGIGEYIVRFPGLATGGGNGGVAHVQPLSGQPRYCSVNEWGPDGTTMDVGVSCFTRNGARADSRFVATFLNTNSASGKLGYLWADQPSFVGEYTPALGYQYNSTGATNTVERQGVGDYWAFLPGLGGVVGSVQISSYGDDHFSCHARDWFAQHGGQNVHVRCRDQAGNPADRTFTLTFMHEIGLKGMSGDHSAYLFADQKLNPSYHPDALSRWSTEAGVPTVTRSAVGTYSVEIPNQPRGGAALVTTAALGKAHCNVNSIRTDATPQRIGVRCFSIAGDPADAAFTLAYLK